MLVNWIFLPAIINQSHIHYHVYVKYSPIDFNLLLP